MPNTPFAQNVIALIWDFDKTLIPGNMQAPLFKKYGVDEAAFWREVQQLEEYYRRRGIRVNKETVYLNHVLTYVREGVFKGLNNRLLKELGKELAFYPGLPEFFPKIKAIIEEDARYKKFDIKVEHYIVSTGFAAMIRGSAIARYVDGIWGCEFIEEPAKPGFTLTDEAQKDIRDLSAAEAAATEAVHEEGGAEITQLGYVIDNTSKTRALFEINKGANKYDDIDVNSKMDEADRPVPFEHMIYIADGPSDVPAFSILNKSGGRTYAVYPKGNMDAFRQVDMLRRDERIQMFGEADYQEGSQTYMWLVLQAKQIADSIVRKKEQAIQASVSQPPAHLI